MYKLGDQPNYKRKEICNVGHSRISYNDKKKTECFHFFTVLAYT